MRLLKKYLPIIFVVIYFVLQLPFLNADPDVNVDPLMRGAWTDEGLYTSQVKNFVNHGVFDMKENSTFVRGPVLNIIQLPFFLIFGTNLIVARLVTVLLTLLVLCLFLREEKLKYFGLFLLLFALLEFHIFQFVHYALAEMVCINMILLGLYFFTGAIYKQSEKGKMLMMLLSSFFIFLCYASKIQYLYVAAILPVTTFIIAISGSVREKKIIRKQYLLFTWSLIFSIGFIVIYYLLWYLPTKDFYDYVMTSESGGRYHATYEKIKLDAQFNWEYIFWLPEFKVFIINFFIVLALASLFFMIKKKPAIHATVALFAIVWITLELHKVPMLYLPNRYIITLFFAGGVFIASFYSEMLSYFKRIKYVVFVIAIAFGIYNLSHYKDAVCRRTYQMSAVNEYLAKYDIGDKPVIGAWASSCCWKNKAITFPVWNNYFNWKDPVKTYKPAVVVTEVNEKDNDETYKSQGIDLEKLSDSIRVFDMWKYKLALYWIKTAK